MSCGMPKRTRRTAEGTARSMSDSDANVIVVGAGLAGLTCARQLHAAGVPVTVLEAADEVGGRVRTTSTGDGFLIDRGFQVLFDAYPAVRRHVDLAALGVAPFDSGADVWTGARLVPVVNPLRHPAGIVRDLTSPVLTVGDAAHLAALVTRALRAPWSCAADAANEQAEDRSIVDLLDAEGFTPAFINRFARGFWGGITLDRTLAASDGVFLFSLKMLVRGAAVLPVEGMGALPRALAARLPAGAIRVRQRVTGLLYGENGVAGVRVGAREHRAAAVVVATDPASARALTGIEVIPDAPVGCVTLYLTSDHDPGVGPRLVIDGTGTSRVNSIAPLSAVQPAYAPPGRHLIGAVLLGPDAQTADEATLAAWAEEDVAKMLPASRGWSVVQSVRTPRALYAQPPGIHRRLPDVVTGTPRLYLASDATVDASINGAMLSGEAAARAVHIALPNTPARADMARVMPRGEEQ